MARCVQLLGIGPETRVLDVGGTLDIWLLAPLMPRLVMLNNQPAAPGAPAPDLLADGRSLPFRDASFDVVFSNSVIEHLGDAQSQVRFAAEVARVGNAYWVQTPNRLFPVEQHLFMPFALAARLLAAPPPGVGLRLGVDLPAHSGAARLPPAALPHGDPAADRRRAGHPVPRSAYPERALPGMDQVPGRLPASSLTWALSYKSALQVPRAGRSKTRCATWTWTRPGPRPSMSTRTPPTTSAAPVARPGSRPIPRST